MHNVHVVSVSEWSTKFLQSFSPISCTNLAHRYHNVQTASQFVSLGFTPSVTRLPVEALISDADRGHCLRNRVAMLIWAHSISCVTEQCLWCCWRSLSLQQEFHLQTLQHCHTGPVLRLVSSFTPFHIFLQCCIQVTKNRFDGDIGSMPLEFNKENLTFSEGLWLSKNSPDSKPKSASSLNGLPPLRRPWTPVVRRH